MTGAIIFVILNSRLRHSGRHLCRRAERTTARSVELIVQPDAHDVVGEMDVGGHGPVKRREKI